MSVDKEDLFLAAIERVESKVDTVQNDVNKFIVIFEKMENIETKHDEHYKIIHRRVGREVDIINEKIDRAIETRVMEIDSINKILASLDIFIFLMKHPKMFVLVLSGLYIFAVEDIRTIILKFLGLL